MNSAEHIPPFNKKFKEVIHSLEHPYITRLVEQVGRFYDPYTAVDSLGYRYGVEIMCIVTTEETRDVYTPILRKKRWKEEGLIFEDETLSLPVITIKSCYETLAKEWIYAIISNTNFIEGKSIHDQ